MREGAKEKFKKIEVQVIVEIRSKEGHKEDDSPTHFHICDTMFLRSGADGLCRGNVFSLDNSWVDTIPPCSDARERLLTSRGRVLRKRKGGQFLDRKMLYEWKTHEAGGLGDACGGKQHYLSFWKKCRLHCLEPGARSLEAGRDCISRTVNALWWDWTACSAL